MSIRRFIGYKIIFNYSLTEAQMETLAAHLATMKLTKFVMPIEKSVEGIPDTIPEEVQ